MDMYRIKARLNLIYDEFLAHENFPQIKDHKPKLMALFLNQADKLFRSGYSVSGHLGVYTYYKNHNKILEINLNEAPEFSDRENFINWFAEKIYEGMTNLGQ